jgi:hypothetical protein
MGTILAKTVAVVGRVVVWIVVRVELKSRVETFYSFVKTLFVPVALVKGVFAPVGSRRCVERFNISVFLTKALFLGEVGVVSI